MNVTNEKLGPALLEALGLRDAAVSELTLHMKVNQLPTLTVTMLVKDESGKFVRDAPKILAEYELRPKSK